MNLSVLRNYAVLPLNMAGSIIGNCAMTIFHLIAPRKFFQMFLKDTGLQQDNKYLDCVQNSVGDIAFLWQRLKAMWFGWVFGNWTRDSVTYASIRLLGRWRIPEKSGRLSHSLSVSRLETIWIQFYSSNWQSWKCQTVLSYWTFWKSHVFDKISYRKKISYIKNKCSLPKK